LKKKVTYILSFIEKSLGFEWLVEKIDREKFELSFILLGSKDTAISSFLSRHQVPFVEIEYRSKRHFLQGLFSTISELRKFKPDIVHTHLFDGGRIGITAAWLLRIKTRIYTRHYSSYHHDYFPRAVMFDKYINSLSTVIVSISPVVTSVLIQREHVDPQKIVYIPHGFDFSYFVEKKEEADYLREKYSIREYPVIGVVSRYNELKGIHFIIEAFSRLLKNYPSAHLVLANAEGDYKAVLQNLLREKLPVGRYTEIQFEENNRALYAMFDLFIHVPIAADAEAFGQTYVEALAMKVPSVFTLSGIAHEFVKSDFNALVVGYKNADEIYEAMTRLLSDGALRERLSANGYKSVFPFTADRMVAQLERLYSSVT
jgi:glycosyltransferase involved in cell wall biosynthesis